MHLTRLWGQFSLNVRLQIRSSTHVPFSSDTYPPLSRIMTLASMSCSRWRNGGAGWRAQSNLTSMLGPLLQEIQLLPHLPTQFPSGTSSASPDTILPSLCVAAAVTWEIESQVREAQRTHKDPVLTTVCLSSSAPVGPQFLVRLSPRYPPCGPDGKHACGISSS